MKSKQTWLLLLLVIILLVICNTTLFASEPIGSKVLYQPNNDILSIEVNNITLGSVLAAISIQSGVEFSMPVEADKNITCSFTNQPLAVGLKKLAHAANVNHILIYGESKDKALIVRMMIVPRSGDVSGKVKPILPSSNSQPAISVKTTSKPGSTTTSIHDIVEQRRLARLKTMSAEKQEKALVLQEEKRKKEEARSAHRQEKKQNKKAKFADKRAEKQTREQALMIEDPERYQTMIQKREEHKELYLQQVADENAARQEQTK